jgi:hypothetical protein
MERLSKEGIRMKKISLLIFTSVFFPLHLFAQAVPLPQLLNFDGQLIDSTTNSAITSPSTVVDFEIWDGNATPSCLLYRETQTISPNSLGEFSAKIGPDTLHTSPATDGDLPWPAIFSNNGQIRAPGSPSCASGYTPAAGHARKLRVIVNGVPLSPDFTIAPVPMATVAETLQGKVASDFLLAAPSAADAFTSVLNGNLRLNNNRGLQLTDTGSNYVTLRAPSTTSVSYSLTLPTDDGSGGQVLTTDGNGVLSWTAPSVAAPVTTVFTRAGNVVAAYGDYTSSQISRTSGGGGVTATNVEAAIVELGTGKISSGSGVISGTMIATSAVTSSHINDATITGSDIAAATILDSNLTNVSVNKLVSGGGQYLTYAPNGNACADGEILKWNLSTTRWECGTGFALPSQAGNSARLLKTDGTNPVWSSLMSGGNTAASPALAFSNYTTTGLFANTTNLLGFSTGGVERMRIDGANGNLGIGILTPNTRLDVAGVITVRPNNTTAGAAGRIALKELEVNGQEVLGLRAPDALAADVILTLPDTDGNAGQLLQTDGTGVLSWVSPVLLPPADSLDFVHLTDTMTLDASTEIAVNGADVLSITNAGTGDSFRVNDVAADTSPFVVDNNGNVGVGVAVPYSGAKLDVAGPVKLGVGGTVFSASGLCSVTSNSYTGGVEYIVNTCIGVPASLDVAVHCSPRQFYYGYITARSTGVANQIAILTDLNTTIAMTCMWMAQ